MIGAGVPVLRDTGTAALGVCFATTATTAAFAVGRFRRLLRAVVVALNAATTRNWRRKRKVKTRGTRARVNLVIHQVPFTLSVNRRGSCARAGRTIGRSSRTTLFSDAVLWFVKHNSSILNLGTFFVKTPSRRDCRLSPLPSSLRIHSQNR